MFDYNVHVDALNDDGVAALFISGFVPGNLGWAIARITVVDGKAVDTVLLDSSICFEGEDNPDWERKPTTVWTIQKNIIFDKGLPEGQYQYMVQAMGGTTDCPQPIEGASATSNVVTLSTKVTPYIDAAFTDGVLADEDVEHEAPKFADGSPDFETLARELAKPGNPLRVKLMGNVMKLMKDRLITAGQVNGHVYALFYENTDPEFRQCQIDFVRYLSLILSNAGKDGHEDAETIRMLEDAGIGNNLILRHPDPKTSIGHNKTMVLVDAEGNGVSLTLGSVNPTVTGFTTQSSNILTVHSPELANQSLLYWQRIARDTLEFDSQQGAELRRENAKRFPLVTLPDGTMAQLWTTPNMPDAVKHGRNPAVPPDMADVFAVVNNTIKFGFGLLFDPGRPSLGTYVAELAASMPGVDFFFAVNDDESIMDTKPRLPADHPPFPVVAGALNRNLGDLLKEFDLLTGAHAIIHSKCYLRDPLASDCQLVTGTHQLGFKASYGNDETRVTISNCPRLGMYYMVNVLQIYMHYLEIQELNSGKGTGYLLTDDRWQAPYQTGWRARIIKYVAENRYPQAA